MKVAFSGSSLSVDWAHGAPDYTAMVTSVTNALSWARARHWLPSISGFYWMQGETDAMSAATAQAYGANLVQLIANVRHSFGLTTATPFVIGQIDLSDYLAYEQLHHLCGTPTCANEKLWNTNVMNAQAHAAGGHVYVTKTSKLPRYDAFLHLTNAAELSIGKAFGELSTKHLT